MEKRDYKEIASMAANGDTKAFSKLYETLYREMYYTAYYCLRDDADTERAILGTVKDGFAAVGRLHSELSFKVFMMKSLCARIKIYFKEYNSSKNKGTPPAKGEFYVKTDFEALEDSERLVLALYAGGRFSEEEIAAFTGFTAGSVKKRLSRAFDKMGIKVPKQQNK